MSVETAGMDALKDMSRVPLWERLAWTPAQAAQVYSLDYEGEVPSDFQKNIIIPIPKKHARIVARCDL